MKETIQKQLDKVAEKYDAIATSDIFRLDGKLINLPQALIDLCGAVEEVDHSDDETEFIWDTIGEYTEASLGDMITGAFWVFTEWHAGQDSIEYAALSALSGIYSPGCSSGPEPESGELIAYEMLSEWFNKKHPETR